jgi:uncharacterized membrane protein YfcA
MHFPVSGVECPIWLPLVLAFSIALVTAPAGLSGAFLLLPFQMSVLGFVSPSVTPTNLIYNVVAIPGGVYRYIRENRMAWPLTWVVVAGTLPGVVGGALIRVRYLPDPRACKLFVAAVLLYLGLRLIRDAVRGSALSADGFGLHFPPTAAVRTTYVSAARISYEFDGKTFTFSPVVMFLLALGVGVVGGIYGVGGGAIIAPFVVTVLGLPAYTIAGAALLGTFLTSIVGIGAFEVLSRTKMAAGLAVQPDWALGFLFGLGGLFGSYAGARLQKYLPEQWIKGFLGLVAATTSAGYIRQFFA